MLRSHPIEMTRRIAWISIASVLTVAGCKEDELDASDPHDKGESCLPADAEGDTDQPCLEGLACEPVGDGGDHVCAAPLELRGLVYDALTGIALEGAHVAALDETGAPVTDVAITDAEGRYVLPVSARRDEDGEIADALKWTLFANAADYQPFPAGVRPAIPVNAQDAQIVEESNEETDDEDDTRVLGVVENASTEIALIPLDDVEQGGVIISGVVGGEMPAGTLVVAEGGADRTPYTIADASGAYTLFNVQPGTVTMRGYRRGLELEPVSVDVESEDVVDIDLPLVTEDPAAMTVLSGSVSLVDPGDGKSTSVVLVPVSVYNDVLERGPVPFGLRAPQPPEAPTVTNDWAIDGVPAGTYKVLSAFENDFLVRDPDECIAGTTIPEITVGRGEDVPVEQSFKITGSLDLIGPGVDAPEIVTAAPDLQWVDDASEDLYAVVVFDALGNVAWEAEIDGVNGGNVSVPYEGPLEAGMYYQFRVTSKRQGGMCSISRTEDLRGVFVLGGASPADGGT